VAGASGTGTLAFGRVVFPPPVGSGVVPLGVLGGVGVLGGLGVLGSDGLVTLTGGLGTLTGGGDGGLGS
jgi:hypothetical protein